MEFINAATESARIQASAAKRLQAQRALQAARRRAAAAATTPNQTTPWPATWYVLRAS